MTEPLSDRALSMLEKLVSYPTTSDTSNLELIHFVADYLAGFGVKSQILPNSDGKKAALLATIGPVNEAGIVLSGHTDVVPVKGQTWTTDPYKLTISDGKAYGRGAVDMKGFAAVVLAAVPEMLEKQLKTPIHILLSYDEETTCLGSLDGIALFGRDIPLPKAAIVGEPTMLEVADAHKGVTIIRTKVHGHEIHSSQPEDGANAILGAAMIIAELDRIADEHMEKGDPSGRFKPGYTTVHTGLIKGGSALNIVPKLCEFAWEVRSLPGLDLTEIPNHVSKFVDEKVLPRLRRGVPHADAQTEIIVEVPGLAPEPGSLAETLALRLAGKNQTICVSYATESGHFQAAGIPTVVCGPGSIVQAHQPNEYIEVSQISLGCDFIRNLVQWCRVN